MAPRTHVSIYKALYKKFGGFAADIIAAIDQAAQDGVDIINLSITPNRRSPIATFFNPIDMALLSAVKAGIFVVQAAGNTGPAPKSMSSFSPWIFTVGATSNDRVYSNSIILGNNVTISGVGLSSGTRTVHKLVLASHALRNGTTVMDAIYVGECQDSSSYDQKLVQGKILVCSYTVRFILGVSTIKQALVTAKNLTAAGLVFYMDSSATGFQMSSTLMDITGILISSPQDSQALLRYYNKFGLTDLRRALSIIPQSPVLFSGTVRFNIDPFGEHSDAELWEALQRAHMKVVIARNPLGLDSEVFWRFTDRQEQTGHEERVGADARL